MTATETLKNVGETVVVRQKTALLAAVGAGDLAVERARAVVGTLRSRAEALPGEAQVQVDLAAKEARSRAQQVASAVRPEVVASTLSGLVSTARTQAVATIESLAVRGGEVVEELRRQPAVRKFVFRAERAVDAVEDRLEDVLEQTAETVAEASDEVTSVAQKTAARTAKAVGAAEEKAAQAAESAKAALEETAEVPAPAKPAKKSSAARTATPAKASARVSSAGTTETDA